MFVSTDLTRFVAGAMRRNTGRGSRGAARVRAARIDRRGSGFAALRSQMALLLLVVTGLAHANFGFDALGHGVRTFVPICNVADHGFGTFVGFLDDDPTTCVTETGFGEHIANDLRDRYGFFREDGGDYRLLIIRNGSRDGTGKNSAGAVLNFGSGSVDNTYMFPLTGGAYGYIGGSATVNGSASVRGECVRFGVDLLVTNFNSQTVTGPYVLRTRINRSVNFDAAEVVRTGGTDALGPSTLADIPYAKDTKRTSSLYNFHQTFQEAANEADDYTFESIEPDASGQVTYEVAQNRFADEECIFEPGPAHHGDALTLDVDLKPRGVGVGSMRWRGRWMVLRRRVMGRMGRWRCRGGSTCRWSWIGW